MNSDWVCEFCDKRYKTLTGFKKHKCKKNRQNVDDIKEKIPTTLKKRKKKDFTSGKNKNHSFTNCNTFQAGHIKKAVEK